MRYKGKFIDDKGNRVYGWFEASSEDVLRQNLEGRGWKVLSVQKGWKTKLHRKIYIYWVPFYILGLFLLLAASFILFKSDWFGSHPQWLRRGWLVLIVGTLLAFLTWWIQSMIREVVRETSREILEEQKQAVKESVKEALKDFEKEG